MQRTLRLALLSMILLLVACDGADLTPTPFPATWTPAPALNPQQSYAIEIPELLAESDKYVGAYVEVTGQYRKRPLLICESESATNPSPATWEISDSTGVTLGAGQFDEALRSLIPNGLTVTVAGYWQQWEGPVGCGKQADQETVWFLEVTDVISPSPIVQVTLTPSPIGGSPVLSEDMITPDSNATTNPNSQPFPTQEDEDGLPINELTPSPADATATAVSDNNGGITNPTSTPFNGEEMGDTNFTPTPPGDNDGLGTAVPTNTRPPDNGSGTTTATPNANATATRTGGESGSPTPTPPDIGQATSTPRPNTGDIIGIDDILSEDQIGFEYISPNLSHDWEIALSASRNITISVAADPGVNIGLELLDGDDNILTSSDKAGAGAIESINNFSVNPDNEYFLRVYTTSQEDGNYIVLVWGSGELQLNARGYLNYNQPKTDTIPASNSVRHFWFFYGEEEEVVDITTSTVSTPPDNDPAMVISMYDTNGEYMELDGDEILWFDVEVENIKLPADGLYAIWLEEISYDAAEYTVSISIH